MSADLLPGRSGALNGVWSIWELGVHCISDIFEFCRLGDLDLKISRLVQVGATKGLTLNPTGSLW